MYQLRIEPKALKNLKRIKNSKERIGINKAFLEIRKNPFIGKKLEGKLKGAYSFRIWPYRIIYEIYRRQVLVIIICTGQRGEVYK